MIRSRMASAMVGSPIWSCQFSMGNWLVMMVEERDCRSSMISKRSRRSASVRGARPRSSIRSSLVLARAFRREGKLPSPLAMARSWKSLGARL